jgi:hypothetical protein
MSEPTTARYDLPPDDPGPRPGDLYLLTDRGGEPTGVWYVIVAVRPVAQRRPHPYRRWALSVIRQDGPIPAAGVAHLASTYPKGIDVDDYWARR